MKTFQKGGDVRAAQGLRQEVSLKFDGFVEVEDAPAVEPELVTDDVELPGDDDYSATDSDDEESDPYTF